MSGDRDANPDLETVAYHEAGHAVAAVVLGRPVTEAVISDDGDGWVGPEFHLPAPPLSPDDRKLIEDQIVELAAGPYAEARRTGKPLAMDDIQVRMLVPDNDWSDVRRCSHALQPNGCDLDALVESGRKLVDTHWDEIGAVAASLKTRRQLTGDEIRRLMASVSTPPKR